MVRRGVEWKNSSTCVRLMLWSGTVYDPEDACDHPPRVTEGQSEKGRHGRGALTCRHPTDRRLNCVDASRNTLPASIKAESKSASADMSISLVISLQCCLCRQLLRLLEPCLSSDNWVFSFSDPSPYGIRGTPWPRLAATLRPRVPPVARCLHQFRPPPRHLPPLGRRDPGCTGLRRISGRCRGESVGSLVSPQSSAQHDRVGVDPTLVVGVDGIYLPAVRCPSTAPVPPHPGPRDQ